MQPSSCILALALYCVASALTVPAVNQTYLAEIRLRRRYGLTLGCYDSLQRRNGAEYASLESYVCDILRAAPESGNAAFTITACRVDRFLCDQNLPLAQVGITVTVNNAVEMSEIRSRLRSIMTADASKLGVDYLQLMDYNECDSPLMNDCSLNAICQNREGSFVCRCKESHFDVSPSGSSGKACAPRCGPGYCAHGGACVDAQLGICKCLDDYAGKNCDGSSHEGMACWLLAGLAISLVAAMPLALWLLSRRRRRSAASCSSNLTSKSLLHYQERQSSEK